MFWDHFKKDWVKTSIYPFFSTKHISVRTWNAMVHSGIRAEQSCSDSILNAVTIFKWDNPLVCVHLVCQPFVLCSQRLLIQLVSMKNRRKTEVQSGHRQGEVSVNLKKSGANQFRQLSGVRRLTELQSLNVYEKGEREWHFHG